MSCTSADKSARSRLVDDETEFAKNSLESLALFCGGVVELGGASLNLVAVVEIVVAAITHGAASTQKPGRGKLSASASRLKQSRRR